MSTAVQEQPNVTDEKPVELEAKDKVQDTAKLHEKTVQKIAKGEVKKKRKYPKNRRKPQTTTREVTVDRRVWEEVEKIKGKGKYTKIEIIDATTVILR